jgi:hypothetical protein
VGRGTPIDWVVGDHPILIVYSTCAYTDSTRNKYALVGRGTPIDWVVGDQVPYS